MTDASATPGMNVAFLLEIGANKPYDSLDGLFALKPDFRMHLIGDDYEFLAWGDPISSDRFVNGLPSECNAGFVVNNLCGHYYFLLYDKKCNDLAIGSSLFSILPLYYCIRGGRLTLSGNVFDLGKQLGINTVSASFMLESLLFNYPLYNTSLIDGIMLLPSNSVLVSGNNGFRITRHTNIELWFASDPEPWEKSLERMTRIFLDTVHTYMPGEHYMTALTGGFDGRTLTAAGLHYDRDFSCYCFGTDTSTDLSTAALIADKTGISFMPVRTDEDYVKSFSREAGRRFIRGSSGIGTFSRAHYVYGSSIISGRTRFILTGNFGSEVLRTVHNTGVMISPALYEVFSSRNPDEAINRLLRSPMTRFLNSELLHAELFHLREAIEELPCFNGRYADLTRNQQFYVFILEEIFRKYFGSEIINQASVLNNRTPFLDSTFLRELFGTGLAGIHSGFRESNPFKRFKGQILYAAIIRKAAPLLGRLPTNRGYCPDDLLSFTGKLKIIASRQKRRRQNPIESYDTLGVNAAWRFNRSFYEDLAVDGDIFDRNVVSLSVGELLTDEKARLFSLLYCVHILKNG